MLPNKASKTSQDLTPIQNIPEELPHSLQDFCPSPKPTLLTTKAFGTCKCHPLFCNHMQNQPGKP